MVKINFVNARHKRRKKILKLAKGYVGSKSTLYKTAHEQVMRSLQYAYRDRRQKKRNFRKLWITRINAGCVSHNISYSQFIHGLLLAKVEVNRKILADIAYQEPNMFTSYVELAKEYLVKKEFILLQQKNDKNPKREEKYKFEEKKVQEEVKIIQEKKDLKKDEELDLKKMLVSDLKKLAKTYSIDNVTKMKKSDLIKSLEKIIKNN